MKNLRPKVICYLTFLTLGIFGGSCVAEIVVSIPTHASLVEQLVGDRLPVHVMLPAGKSPHTFDPSPSDLVKLSKAELGLLRKSSIHSSIFWLDDDSVVFIIWNKFKWDVI